jgi:uncharacterized membrane protein (GlpM family)
MIQMTIIKKIQITVGVALVLLLIWMDKTKNNFIQRYFRNRIKQLR